MTMTKLTIDHHDFENPVTVTIEASECVILEQRLNTIDGEQYDHIKDVLSMGVEGDTVYFDTCRTVDGWKRGEGRERWIFPRYAIEAAYI